MNEQDYFREADRLVRSEGIDPWTALMRALVERLRSEALPSQLQRAFSTADRHWHGEPQDLASLKLAVWDYIDSLGRPGARNVGILEGRLARALLCVLDAEGDEESRSMKAEWFSNMIDPSGATVFGGTAQ